jgi:hypothetical protein
MQVCKLVNAEPSFWTGICLKCAGPSFGNCKKLDVIIAGLLFGSCKKLEIVIAGLFFVNRIILLGVFGLEKLVLHLS